MSATSTALGSWASLEQAIYKKLNLFIGKQSHSTRIREKQESSKTERQSDQQEALLSTHFNAEIQLPVRPKIRLIYSAWNHMMSLEACVQSTCCVSECKWKRILYSGHTNLDRLLVVLQACLVFVTILYWKWSAFPAGQECFVCMGFIEFAHEDCVSGSVMVTYTNLIELKDYMLITRVGLNINEEEWACLPIWKSVQSHILSIVFWHSTDVCSLCSRI